MTLQTTQRLLQILRANGVNYFKSTDVEIRIGALETPPAAALVGPEPTTPIVPRGTGPVASEQRVNDSSRSLGDVPAKEMKIPHQLTEVVSLLKMSDEQLVDKLFPEGAQPPPAQAAD